MRVHVARVHAYGLDVPRRRDGCLNPRQGQVFVWEGKDEMCSMMQTRVKARGSDPKCSSAQYGRVIVIVTFAGTSPKIGRSSRVFSCVNQMATRCIVCYGYCPSVYRSRGDLGHHGTLTNFCVTRVCTNFPRMFQVIRTMWTMDPTNSVQLDDL